MGNPMKKTILVLMLFSLSAFADNEAPSCESQCRLIKNPQAQTHCLQDCADGVTVARPVRTPFVPVPTVNNNLTCEERCQLIKNPQAQVDCKSNCPPAKPETELSGCQKTDARTITCGDGVFVKSNAVNEDSIIKHVKEINNKPKIKPSKSSEKQ